jgi:hypothetical protein
VEGEGARVGVGKAKSMAWKDEGVCGWGCVSVSASISGWVVGGVGTETETGTGVLNGVMAMDKVEVRGKDVGETERSCNVLESAD